MIDRVLFVSPEVPPWVKSGGLADVTSALPQALRASGIDIRILAPGYAPVLDALPGARSIADLPAHAGLPACRLLEADHPASGPIFLIDCPELFARPGTAYQDASFTDWPDNNLRFGLLGRTAALIASAQNPLSWQPQVVHCNDWPTGLVPAYQRLAQSHAPCVMAIHNLSHQGVFDGSTRHALGLPESMYGINGIEYYGKLSFLKAGVFYAERLVTVSPTYAREIQTDAGGQGLGGLLRARGSDLVGILNGIDTAAWNPATDPLIAHTYDVASIARKSVNKLALQRRLGLELGEQQMLLGVVSRLAHQKGIDWLLDIVPALLELPVGIAVLGSGEKKLETELITLASRHPGRIGVVIGFDEALAHLIEAGADAFLMPSRYEPCGLNQMYSLRYGTPPVVRATGGLADTVVDCTEANLRAGTANGFSFERPSAQALLASISRAVEVWRTPNVWRALQRRGMAQDHSWTASARRYLSVYDSAVEASHSAQ
ncbi:MAG: glycogen synthase GlgA [Pseudomonadota bacterium]|nr:glycogen synthase GlgA [Pseudomonadota bacterium]